MQTVRPQQSPRVRPPGLLLVTVSVHVKSLSHVQLFVTPWTLARQAPLSMGFFRQECWSGLPFPSPGDLPDPGIEPASPALTGGFFTTEPPGKPPVVGKWMLIFGEKRACPRVKNVLSLLTTFEFPDQSC